MKDIGEIQVGDSILFSLCYIMSTQTQLIILLSCTTGNFACWIRYHAIKKNGNYCVLCCLVISQFPPNTACPISKTNGNIVFGCIDEMLLHIA